MGQPKLSDYRTECQWIHLASDFCNNGSASRTNTIRVLCMPRSLCRKNAPRLGGAFFLLYRSEVTVSRLPDGVVSQTQSRSAPLRTGYELPSRLPTARRFSGRRWVGPTRTKRFRKPFPCSSPLPSSAEEISCGISCRQSDDESAPYLISSRLFHSPTLTPFICLMTLPSLSRNSNVISFARLIFPFVVRNLILISLP